MRFGTSGQGGMWVVALAVAACGGGAGGTGGALDAASEDTATLADATDGDALGDTISQDAVTGDTVSADAVQDSAVQDGAAQDVADSAGEDAADSAVDAAQTDAGPVDVAAADAGSCSDFAQPPVTSPTSITVVNNTQQNIYLGAPAPDCKFYLGFSLAAADGAPLQASYDACQFTCGQLQNQMCACPPIACQPPMITLLAPGKKIDYGWPGTIFKPAAMPKSCFQDPSCAAQDCLVETAAASGTQVLVTAYTQAQCDGQPCTDCTPGMSGNCVILGGTNTAGTAIKATATWTGTSPVVLSIQ